MAKKNSPGCDCCQKVLVWDLGYQDQTSSGTRRYLHTYSSVNSENRYLTMFGEDVEVHFACPPPLVNRLSASNEDFGLNFWANNPGFNPYDAPPENDDNYDKFWTRSIFDYKLIYWPFPTAGTDLDTTAVTGIGGCGGYDTNLLDTEPGVADHEFHQGLPSGLPTWWDDVVGDLAGTKGTWVGRIVMETRAPASSGSPFGFAQSLFINSMNAPTVTHGMTVTTDNNTFAANDTYQVNLSGEDLTVGASLQGVASISPAAIADGEVLFTAMDVRPFDAKWCAGSGLELAPIQVPFAMRNTITIEVADTDYLKDFVIQAGRLPHEEYSAYYKNLYEVPIDDGLSGPGP